MRIRKLLAILMTAAVLLLLPAGAMQVYAASGSNVTVDVTGTYGQTEARSIYTERRLRQNQSHREVMTQNRTDR